MLIPIRIILLSLIMSLLLFTSSTAGTILYATVRIDNDVYSDYYDIKQLFPSSLYRFTINGYDLRYDYNVPMEDHVKDLSIFTLRINARLALISFDKQTGVARFKLKLTGGDWLKFTGRGSNMVYFETGGTDLKGGGTLKLANGENPEFIIEGSIQVLNGELRWISFHRNKYFDIEIDSVFNIIELKLLHDFPVIVAR